MCKNIRVEDILCVKTLGLKIYIRVEDMCVKTLGLKIYCV